MTRRMQDARQATNPTAREILRICEAGGYIAASGGWVSLAEAQSAAEQGTRLYTPEMLMALREATAEADSLPPIEISDSTTQKTAAALAAQGPVVLLNFASARNPGGGFLGGARAQEEELCRCSGLYPTLLTQPDYYAVNRENRSALYTDHLIYSPRVPFVRVDADAPLLAEPFFASVITTPAPNAGALLQNSPGEIVHIPATFERRWANVLAVAHDQGHRVVLLGAWGCGAFRNDPRDAAQSARDALKRHGSDFDRVVFAIPGGGNQSRANLEAFREVFKE